jgi:prepilin-type N-terminal cleavage/methylation domain-containing protein/prepilin-type processing-associated H-X9-DG protein
MLHLYPYSKMRNLLAGFTLVELLVVIGIIAVLISLLLPTLAKARQAANTAKCLSNMRSMEIAQCNYATDNRGYLVQAGLGHGGEQTDLTLTWFTTLQKYYSNALLPRCPSDDSPYWFPGPTVPGTSPPSNRMTSYGINDLLDVNDCPWGPGFAIPFQGYAKITQVGHASATIQFVEMAYVGSGGQNFAGADHVHVENFYGSGANVPSVTAEQMQINAHGGPAKSWQSISNYGFLDGHAETLGFKTVYQSIYINKFDPAIAQ